MSAPLRRRWLAAAGAAAALACSSPAARPTPRGRGRPPTAPAPAAAAGSNDEPGDKVVIGFSAPAADHGWMGAITKSAVAEADKYEDVELRQAEATNDVNLQISQIEQFINDGVDAIVLLPFDGAALTEVATKAMEAGIPVINVDREFDGPERRPHHGARRQLRHGRQRRRVHLRAARRQARRQGRRDRRHRLAAADAGPQPGLRGRARATAASRSSNRVAADFTVQGGEAAAANLLQAAPQLDAIWNHDDDQGVGVLAAIENAGRDEFFMVGGAGSKNVMEAIKADDSVLKATVIYPSTQAADGIKLARLAGAGQVDERPGRGRGAAHRPAVRAGRHQGERRPVPADRPSSPERPTDAGRVPAPQGTRRGARRRRGGRRDREQPTPGRRHGRVRVHGRRALAGLAQRTPVLRPAAAPGHGGGRGSRRGRA